MKLILPAKFVPQEKLLQTLQNIASLLSRLWLNVFIGCSQNTRYLDLIFKFQMATQKYCQADNLNWNGAQLLKHLRDLKVS